MGVNRLVSLIALKSVADRQRPLPRRSFIGSVAPSSFDKRLISGRWPAPTRCLKEYERFMEPVNKDYAQFVSQRNRDLGNRSLEWVDTHIAGATANGNGLEEMYLWSIFNQ